MAEHSLSDLEGEHLISGLEILSSEGEHPYRYGVVFTLDGVSYEALEDPEDGYRSCRGALTEAEQPPRFSFPPQPVLMVDPVTGKAVLSIGTGDVGDWYPYFPEHFSCNNQVQEVSPEELQSILEGGFLC